MTSPNLRTMPPVFRFAPSTNGYLHLGHGLSALHNAGMAKAMSAAERAQRMASGAPYARRLDMAAASARVPQLTWDETGAGNTGNNIADPAAWGDVVLARKDTPTSYHLAVVVDDAAQGVTDVVRGRDLF